MARGSNAKVGVDQVAVVGGGGGGGRRYEEKGWKRKGREKRE